MKKWLGMFISAVLIAASATVSFAQAVESDPDLPTGLGGEIDKEAYLKARAAFDELRYGGAPSDALIQARLDSPNDEFFTLNVLTNVPYARALQTNLLPGGERIGCCFTDDQLAIADANDNLRRVDTADCLNDAETLRDVDVDFQAVQVPSV